MPEGPSIVIAKEELQQFVGKKIISLTGNAKIDINSLVNKKMTAVKSWGKHLLLCFDGFTLRIHFLMWGKYFVNSSKDTKPRLALKFARGKELNFYNSAIRVINEPLDEVYDWSGDVMNEQWDMKKARKKLKKIPDTMVADVLLDQDIFAGVGNIIKNEVLYRTRIHPASATGALSSKKLTELLKDVHTYCFLFLEWKKQYVLAKHWEVYKRKVCKRDGSMIKKEYLGIRERRTFFCDACQQVYH